MVGKSYSPEFYSWIENKSARNAMEKIAIETEEDYQSLVKLLEKFNVTVIRPDVDSNHNNAYNTYYNKFNVPPMTPRDYVGTFNKNIFIERYPNNIDYIGQLYNNVKDDSWQYTVNNVNDLSKLPNKIINELYQNFNLANEIHNNTTYSLNSNAHKSVYEKIVNIKSHNTEVVQWDVKINEIFAANNASVTRVGKDLYVPESLQLPKELLNSDYRLNKYKGDTHADSCFVPVVPGLIITLQDYQNYSKTFPNWEIISLPDQSWEKVKPFLELKKKNKGKWWIPGQENNNALTETVETWLGHWVGFVEETVFDTNMLVINEKNVIVNNYNKQVFNALEKYNVTPHICNFRHRYFWDGGLHCITADLDRVGNMNDYFPERNYKIKEF
jgi:hypothetical protein